AYRITVLPMLVYLVSLWGIGLGGGWWLAFVAGASQRSWAPQVAGARGFWIAACLGLAVAAVALAATLARVWRTTRSERRAENEAGAAARAGQRPRAQPGGPDRNRSR